MTKVPVTSAVHVALEAELRQRMRIERPHLVQRVQQAIADDTTGRQLREMNPVAACSIRVARVR